MLLDTPVANCRAQPIILYYFGRKDDPLDVDDIKGFLHWASNKWRKLNANPFEDAHLCVNRGVYKLASHWLCYPSNAGLVGSMRLVGFREGLIDLFLLRQLGRARHENVLDRIEANMFANVDFRLATTNPSAFNEWRTLCLDTLGP